MQDADGTVAVLHRSEGSVAVRTPAPDLRHRLRIARVATDWAVAAVAISVSGLLRSNLGASAFLVTAITAATFPIVVAIFGGYRSDDARDGLAPVAAGLAATAFAAAVIDASRESSLPADRLLVLASMLVALEVVASLVWSWIWRSSSVRRLTRVPTAVIGVPGEDAGLADVLAVLDDLDPVAIVDGRRLGSSAGPAGDQFVVTVDRVLERSDASCLLIVDGAVPSVDLDELRRVARLHEVEMRVVIPVPEMFPGVLRTRTINGRFAMVHLPRSGLTRGALLAKRALDIVLGAVAALITLPIMVAIGIAIKMTSPGPVLFRQERTTSGGKVFRIVKFRTMEIDPEGAVPDPALPFFKITDDPRLTRIGRWIRPLSLDELPQLWNVLRGDMSLVGPRPLPVGQVDAHPDLLGPRHDVPAGMTGWWQVNGRSDLPAEEAVVFDRFYIENWSFGLDLRILVKTIGVLFDRRGAY